MNRLISTVARGGTYLFNVGPDGQGLIPEIGVLTQVLQNTSCQFPGTEALDEETYSAKAPRTPLLNSNYDGFFIAGMLQLRYIYSMPVERIVKYFADEVFQELLPNQGTKK